MNKVATQIAMSPLAKGLNFELPAGGYAAIQPSAQVSEQAFSPAAYQAAFSPGNLDTFSVAGYGGQAGADLTQPIVTSSNAPTTINQGFSTTQVVVAGLGLIFVLYFVLKHKRG